MHHLKIAKINRLILEFKNAVVEIKNTKSYKNDIFNPALVKRVEDWNDMKGL